MARLRLPLPAGLNRKRLAILAAAMAFCVLLTAHSWRIPVLAQLERVAYDIRLAATAPAVDQDDRIVLLVVDEATIAETRRRSPVDRAMLARAITALDAIGPRAVGIDILFDQPTNAAEDRALLKSLRDARHPIRVADAIGEDQEILAPWQVETLRDFFAALKASRTRPASAAFYADADGIVRRSAPQTDTIAGELAELAGISPVPPDMPIEFRRPASDDVPVFARLPILPLAHAKPDVLAALAPMLAGRIVLIGADIPGTDRHRTPLSALTGEDMSGLEVHAQILANLLDRVASPALSGATLWLWAVLPAILGLCSGWIRTGTIVRITMAIAMVAAMVVLSTLIERPAGIQTYGLPLVGGFLSWLLMSLVGGALSRSTTIEERRIARQIVGRYLPRDVALAIQRQPELLEVHGRRTSLAIIFTDLAGFTDLSESLLPERLSAILNGYLEGMSELVLSHGGTLDKFIGDAVVAFWGAPLDDPEKARKALAAALAMEGFAADYAARAAAEGVSIGKTRIGAHYGEAIVGNFGGRNRVQYTAVGDAMNLAARLETANKALGTTILASEAIMAQARDLPARELGLIAVVGRAAPVRVYQLGDGITAEAASGHASLVARLRDGAPGAADELSERIATFPGDHALAFFRSRAEISGWSGVYRLETK
ncbi:adenylate/guanylate cyclase domain-containing protein [Sphingobium sp.]|uniref:adenylate/guanylate cyclase domain-containing protein n=1 Tax=Sphingobium sp. TaxID=1912891 RepID=UPI0028BDC33F|nr:adenylate/guanylate cyclase domain-containing protein [Sphingobium sp.]